MNSRRAFLLVGFITFLHMLLGSSAAHGCLRITDVKYSTVAGGSYTDTLTIAPGATLSIRVKVEDPEGCSGKEDDWQSVDIRYRFGDDLTPMAGYLLPCHNGPDYGGGSSVHTEVFDVVVPEPLHGIYEMDVEVRIYNDPDCVGLDDYLIDHNKVTIQTGQVVQVPYCVSTGGWSTGVAITNLSESAMTGLTLDMVKASGAWHSVVANYRTVLGTIGPYAQRVDFIDNLYGKTWTEGRFWCEIWHPGIQKFTVTVFLMNVSTGQAEGFGFHPFFSESRNHTFEEWIFEPLPVK